MEDHDQSDLPEVEWELKLREAVENFNEEYGTKYDSTYEFYAYCNWRYEKIDK